MLDHTLLFPNFNNAHVLPLMFQTLTRNVDCAATRLVAIDDGSEDDGVRVLKRLAPTCGFKSVEIIELPHRGIIEALNTGLAACRTEIIFRIDGDATVETPGWMERMAARLAHEQVGLVGGHVLFDDGRVHSFGRHVMNDAGLHDMGTVPSEPIGHRTFCSLVYRPKIGFPGGPPHEVDAALGVCVAFRRSDALACGGFDTRFAPVWIEDDDFCIALRKLGKRIVVDPSIQVVHRVSLRGPRQPGLVAGAPALPSLASEIRRRIAGPLKGSLPPQITTAIRALRGHSIPPVADRYVEKPLESSAWRRSILESHYRKWEEKWGFHPLNPRLDHIHELYWDTALAWRLNPSNYRNSQAFARSTLVT